jgi:hypothetical protein
MLPWDGFSGWFLGMVSWNGFLGWFMLRRNSKLSRLASWCHRVAV